MAPYIPNNVLFYKLCSSGNIPKLIKCINAGINMEPTSKNHTLINGIKNLIMYKQRRIIQLFLDKYNIPAQYIYISFTP